MCQTPSACKPKRPKSKQLQAVQRERRPSQAEQATYSPESDNRFKPRARGEGILCNTCDVLLTQAHIFEAKNAYKAATRKVLCTMILLVTAARKASEISRVNRVEVR